MGKTVKLEYSKVPKSLDKVKLHFNQVTELPNKQITISENTSLLLPGLQKPQPHHRT